MLSINNNDYDLSGREKKILELYDQGKSTRDIAKELRMSLRDISIILRKNQASHGIAVTDHGNIDNDNSDNNNNNSLNQKATQAYKLFSEGKKLPDVDIELGLREKEASKLFSEFLRLKGQQELYNIYQDEKYYLRSLLKLHRLLKREVMAAADNNNIEWFVNMVKTGTYKIPEIQKQYSKAKDELEVIEYKRVMSKHELDNMNSQIILLRRSMYQLSATCNNKRNEIAYLQNQIQGLEEYVCRLKNDCQQKIET